MKILFAIIFLLFIQSCNIPGTPETYRETQTSLYGRSDEFATLLEKKKIESAIKMIDKSYYSKNKTSLDSLFKVFTSDFLNLPKNTERFNQLVFPTGFYLYRISYIHKPGILLQLDVIYKKEIATTDIVKLGLITTSSFKKVEGRNMVPAYDFE